MSASLASPESGQPPPRELTARAVIAGVVIGAALAAGNVYTSLKTNFLDPGAITAVLFTFTFFAVFRRAFGAALTAAETNIAQTTAASAALATAMIGLNGAIPALHILGHDYPTWLLIAWGLGIGVLALGLGSALRPKLVVEEQLPFPSGAATAEVIRTMHAEAGEGRAAVRRTALVLTTALVSAVVTWLREAPALLPQALFLPVTVGGLAASSLTLGAAVSPLMAGTGVLMGTRAAASMCAGGLLAWVGLAPAVVGAHAVPSAEYGALTGWLVWPAIGVLMSSTLVPLLMSWRALARTLRDLAWLRRRRPEPGAERGRALTALMAAAALSTIVIGWRAFDLHPGTVAVALVASLALSSMCARTAGETDIAPVGSVSMLTQLLFGGRGAATSILAGSVVNGQAAQASVSLWSYRTGRDLQASPRAQLVAQLVGIVTGAVVAVPVYHLLVRAYGLGSERLPASVALTWRGTAEGVQGGLGTLPPGALAAGVIGLAAGAVLTLLDRTRAGRWLPSAAALGVGMITPASLSVTALAGAAALALFRRARPGITDGDTHALGAGALAGESLTGVAVALMMALR